MLSSQAESEYQADAHCLSQHGAAVVCRLSVHLLLYSPRGPPLPPLPGPVVSYSQVVPRYQKNSRHLNIAAMPAKDWRRARPRACSVL